MKLTWTTFKAMNTPTEWRARFIRNSWVLAWCGFAGLFLFMLMACSAFWERPWLGNFLSAFGTGIAVMLAILIYAHGQAAQAKATREQMDHLQQLNREANEHMASLFQRQMDHLSEQTNRQITEYSRETLKVVSKLGENSLLLAELLKHELEDAIGENNNLLEHAQKEFNKTHQPKFLRTPDERAVQIAQSGRFLERVRAWGDYLQRKYHNLTSNFRDSL